MATQTSLVAQQVRIRQWAEQIRNCQNRPKGMDVETWCTQNNLTKANYYYRLRRVRQICLDQMQDMEKCRVRPRQGISHVKKTILWIMEYI